jgi:hypothetical protein
VECDGDKYHRPEQWAEDMRRQRALERVGWVFWRCFAAAYVRRRDELLQDLAVALAKHGIQPLPSASPQPASPVEHRRLRVSRGVSPEAVAGG